MSFAAALSYLAAICAGGLAFAVAVRGRRSVAPLSFVAGMAGFALESLFSGLTAEAVLPASVAMWQSWRLVVLAALPGLWLLFSLTYARAEERALLAKWSWVWAASVFVPVAVVVTFWGRLLVAVGEPSLETGWRLVLGGPAGLLNLAFLLGAIGVLMNLERTYRASVGTLRWRIKFMVLGLGVLFIVRAYTSSQELLFHNVKSSLQVLDSGALFLGCLLVLRSLLRSGHFDITVSPSSWILHQSVTVLVAGIYLLVLGVLARLMTFLGYGVAFEVKSFLVLVALVLLAVALFSDRVRLGIRRFVSRHFQRPLHDYRVLWRTFTERTARCLREAELCQAVAELVSDTLQALSVTVWMVDEVRGSLRLAASTSLSSAGASRVEFQPDEAATVIQALRRQTEPVDIDASSESWTLPLRRLQPDAFKRGGHRLCVPLAAGGEMLGLMLVGDRVEALPFSGQDLEVLKSVAAQAAASLLNVHLAEKLAQARQLEAFQAMSAFFVHDLKNTASSLSLMLRNFPVHYQDAAFREDALRSIARTVSHLNDRIGQLNVLRQELELRPVESDLNALVAEALKGQEFLPQVELIRELRPLPPLRLDPAQIQKVVTNLLLNAREALGAMGQIRVETSRRNGWAVLSVADNGCGMPADFVQNRLFRPFATTKKKGLGIGMFHCKMIIEAHRGRIEVQSEPGKGTAFRVLLPLAGAEPQAVRQ